MVIGMDVTDIIRKAGGHKAVAEALGISFQAVYLWKQVPAHRVLQIARMAQLRPSDVRADLYPPGMVA